METEEKEIPVLKIALIAVSALLLFALIHVVLIETGHPLFGKTKKLQKENQYLSHRLDTMSALKILLDSVINDNLLLKEQVTTDNGVFYEVQIGAFKEFDLGKYQEELVRLRIEKDNELNKYIIAKFSSLKKAKAFVADMRRIGITDAFIVGRVNGQRVSVSEASRLSENNNYYLENLPVPKVDYTSEMAVALARSK